MNKRQGGFGVIETLLVIIVVGVLGATGWYALHTKHQTDQILSESEKASQNSVQRPLTFQKNILIQAWGVEMPSQSDQLFSYSLSGNTASFISEDLAQKYGCTQFGAGLIQRYKGNEYPFSDLTTTAAQASLKDPEGVKKIGIYYYIWRNDDAACFDIHSPDYTLASNAQLAENRLTGKMFQGLMPVGQ